MGAGLDPYFLARVYGCGVVLSVALDGGLNNCFASFCLESPLLCLVDNSNTFLGAVFTFCREM